MKMFKRLAAVLLAGAMVLAFTACGSKSLGQQAEEALMNQLNSQLPGDQQYENDPELHDKIYEALGKIKEDGTLAVEDYPEDAQIEAPTEDGTYVTYTLTGANGKAREVTGMKDGMPVIATQEAAAGKVFNIDKVDKVAVATRVVNGKTYIGMAVQVTGKMVDATEVPVEG